MGNLYLGRGAAVGVGFEGTWGTPVARTQWYRLLTGADPERALEKVPRNVLELSGSVGTSLGHYTSNDFAGGNFSILAGYSSLGVWLRAIFGSASDGGGPPYTHTYTPGDITAIPLTLEFCNPSALAVAMSEVYEGCLINKGRFHCAVGEQAVLQVDEFFAETTGGIVAAGSPTFGSNDTIVHHHQAGTWEFNGANYTIRSFDLAFDNGYARRQQLGSNLTSIPAPANPRTWKPSITLEVQDALTTAYYADTQDSSSTLAFTESGSVDLTWTMQNVYIEKVSRPIASHGMILQTVDLCCEGDGTNHGISVALKNAVATGHLGLGRY
jgi:hypothetical protein